MKEDEARRLVRVSGLCSLRCLDTNGRVTEVYLAHKNPVPLILNGCISE